MTIAKELIQQHNSELEKQHQRSFDFIAEGIADANGIIDKLKAFQVAIPSWALGTGGTRFGRFPGGGEPRTIEEKLDDVAQLNALTGANRTVSLHVPAALGQYAESLGLGFDAINSNTFQDDPSTTDDGAVTFKFGSLAAADPA